MPWRTKAHLKRRPLGNLSKAVGNRNGGHLFRDTDLSARDKAINAQREQCSLWAMERARDCSSPWQIQTFR